MTSPHPPRKNAMPPAGRPAKCSQNQPGPNQIRISSVNFEIFLEETHTTPNPLHLRNPILQLCGPTNSPTSKTQNPRSQPTESCTARYDVIVSRQREEGQTRTPSLRLVRTRWMRKVGGGRWLAGGD